MTDAKKGVDAYVDLYFEDLFEVAGSEKTQDFVTTVSSQIRETIDRMDGVTIRATDDVSPHAWPKARSPDQDDVVPNQRLMRLAIRATPEGRRQLAEAAEIHGVEATGRRNRLPILVQLRKADWNKDIPGLTTFSLLGRILTGTATKEAIDALEEDPDVISIEASRGGVPECAISMPWIRADVVHHPPANPPPAETGDAAIVAVVDAGIDVLHEAFQRAGKTRLLYLWDQSDGTGPTPHAVNGAVFPQQYGTLHTAADIDGYIAAGAVGKNLKRDPLGHGTHVASIAAGSPVKGTTFPGGVAPDAAIIVVIPKLAASANDPQSLGYSVTHVDALAFIRAAADEAGKPVAVNVSLGMNAGAHDGSSLVELAFDAFSNGGRDAGAMIVKSAGNEFGSSGHANVQAFQGGLIPIEWRTTSAPRVKDYLEFWYASGDDLELTLVEPGGGSCTVDHASPRGRFDDPGRAFTMYLDLTRFHVDNGDTRVVVLVRDNRGAPITVAGDWKLMINGRSVSSDGTVHAWVERDDARALSFSTGSANGLTLSIPGTARSVVTVGACEPRDPLSLSGSSSRGPTRDDRHKPELVAPGVDITAAQAGTANGLVAMTGTSMAAPHVTGAVALLFSSRVHAQQPQLNAVQVRAALVRGVKGFNGRWQDGFGHGRLDVVELLAAFG